jgi:hypothetical protein
VFVGVTVTDDVGVAVGVPLLVIDGVGVTVFVGVNVTLGVGVTVCVGVTLGVGIIYSNELPIGLNKLENFDINGILLFCFYPNSLSFYPLNVIVIG